MSNFSLYNFANQKVLIRVDFNVPLDEQYTITDDSRMQAAIPTIKKILDDGGSVIFIYHLERQRSRLYKPTTKNNAIFLKIDKK